MRPLAIPRKVPFRYHLQSYNNLIYIIFFFAGCWRAREVIFLEGGALDCLFHLIYHMLRMFHILRFY